MPPPAPPLRPPLACLVCLICPLLLGACGNRGELYLASELEPAVEADLRRLGSTPGGAVPGEAPASLPGDVPPVVPDDGAAPTSSPSFAPEGDAAAPGADIDGEAADARRRPRGDAR